MYHVKVKHFAIKTFYIIIRMSSDFSVKYISCMQQYEFIAALSSISKPI